MENSVSNNRAKVIGTICEPIKFSHETYGESFYIFTVSVPRFSGTEDEIRVMAPGLLVIGNDYSVGDKVIIEGQFRSFNDINDGKSRLVLTLFAKEMEVYASEYDEQNPNIKKLILDFITVLLQKTRLQGLRMFAASR